MVIIGSSDDDENGGMNSILINESDEAPGILWIESREGHVNLVVIGNVGLCVANEILLFKIGCMMRFFFIFFD